MKKMLITTAVAALVTAGAATAQESYEDFELSEDLQSELEAYRDAVQEQRAEIRDALEGLTEEERAEVREDYADAVEALREEGRALREEVAAEFEAAGLEAPDRGEGRRGGGAGQGGGEGRGGPGGPGGTGGPGAAGAGE